MGHVVAIAAYLMWGLFPVYWKQLDSVPAMEILAHRAIWCAVFCWVIARGRQAIRETLRDRKKLAVFFATSLVIGGNWYLYTWGVISGHIKECSLGYFINPLLSVALGVFFLKERIRAGQLVAILIAGGAVGYQIYEVGHFPMISLGLALTFGFYGLIRKLYPAQAIDGLAVETTFLFLPAVFWLVHTTGDTGGNWDTHNWWLMGSGIVTALPLIAFAAAAKRLALTHLGFYQYIAPCCQFLLGVFLYNETFTDEDRIVFPLIWLALAVFIVDTLRHIRKKEVSRA